MLPTLSKVTDRLRERQNKFNFPPASNILRQKNVAVKIRPELAASVRAYSKQPGMFIVDGRQAEIHHWPVSATPTAAAGVTESESERPKLSAKYRKSRTFGGRALARM